MKWRPATNPEIIFEISDEGELLGFEISPKFPNELNLNQSMNAQDIYEEMVRINSNVREEDYV